MYRVSPFTYLIQGMLSIAVGRTTVICSPTELLHFQPPSGQTCSAYMSTYIGSHGGYLQDPSATSDCSFCSIESTDVFLATFQIYYKDRWRNLGLLSVYIFVNIFLAIFLYWLARVVSHFVLPCPFVRILTRFVWSSRRRRRLRRRSRVSRKLWRLMVSMR